MNIDEYYKSTFKIRLSKGFTVNMFPSPSSQVQENQYSAARSVVSRQTDSGSDTTPSLSEKSGENHSQVSENDYFHPLAAHTATAQGTNSAIFTPPLQAAATRSGNPPEFAPDAPLTLRAGGSQGRLFQVQALDGSEMALKTFYGRSRAERQAREQAANERLPPSDLFPRLHGEMRINGENGLVFDYIDGCTLDKFLQRMRHCVSCGEYSTDDMRRCIGDMIFRLLDACRLMYLHGVSHGDLKPKNVIIDSESRLMICDFGLATVYESPSPAIATNIANNEGSVGFMGPEAWQIPERLEQDMIAGKTAAQIGHARDVFAAGSIIYPLLKEMHRSCTALEAGRSTPPETPPPLDPTALHPDNMYASAQEGLRQAECHATGATPEQQRSARQHREDLRNVLCSHRVSEDLARLVVDMVHPLAARRPDASTVLQLNVHDWHR